MEPRIVKGEICLSCKGQIGYFPDTDEFKCLSCGKSYNPEENRAKEARRKYWASQKGRKVQANYGLSEKGVKAHKRHQKTVKGQLTLRRYYYSDKGQEAHQRHQNRVKLYKAIDNWLKENPGKTIQDYLKEHPSESSQ